jgi:cyclopropane fatty-acyl-phospholipid synthase-like methyltransferase
MIVASVPQSAADVAHHYDELDVFYREIWGRHVHHGLWVTGRETPDIAVVALVDRLAERLALQPGQQVCDIGCGYGATALRLAQRQGIHVTALTISSVQAAHAREAVRDAPLVTIECRDWLSNSYGDSSFDKVYSIESSEHMIDKEHFFREAFRTLRPGGQLAVFAWLAHDHARRWEVKHLLEPICREGRLPSIGTESEYSRMAESAGFRIASIEDLSRAVRRTWTICARRVITKLATKPDYRRFVRSKESANRSFLFTLFRIIAAYRTGSMRYCLLMYTKPA